MAQALIRVLLVDDHVVVRKGIRALLSTEPDIDVVAEAKDGAEAIAMSYENNPDVILMDLMMPGIGGIEAIQFIKARQPEARILVLTSFATNDEILPAIKAGALGYLLKDSEPRELIRAIHRVYRGELSLHPEIARRLLNELKDPSEQNLSPDKLTELEMVVLQMVARGLTEPEIVSQIGDVDVRTEVSHILNKLHVAGRTQAVLYALREGLTSLEDVAPDYVSRLLMMVGKEAVVDGVDLPVEKTSTMQLWAEDSQREIKQELALAGEVQASFLPDRLPQIDGWQMTATLEPAHETSGDFYDVIPLPDNHLGIVIADVADKGMGAALYMALARTLIRTYATEYVAQPEQVLSETNRRILQDTNTGLFVTAFYGVLDTESGILTYCNAGHNPPYLIGGQNAGTVQMLNRTGIILGVFDDIPWTQDAVQLEPGDTVILYTDGLPDAQNQQGKFFDTERLLETAQDNRGQSAQVMKNALLSAVADFSRNAPARGRDDLTIMILQREE